MVEFADVPFGELMTAVAADDPVPGAGPSLAWTCAVAAALVEMVSAVSLRKQPEHPGDGGSADRVPGPGARPGERRVVSAAGVKLVVLNGAGELFAVDKRCSHEDRPLADSEADQADTKIECPRHGSRLDLRTRAPAQVPA